MQLSKDIFLKLKESVSFFSSFSTGELLALLKLANSESFDDGEIIFKEKTRGDKMYIILTGTVRISKYLGNQKEEVLVKLQPGACFGEMGVIDQSPRSASATVEGGNAVMLVIAESTLSEHNVLLAYKLYKNFALMLAERLRDTNDKLQNSAIQSNNSKSQLKDLLKKKTEQGSSLEGANLKGADFSETFMNNANLQNSVMIEAKLNGTKCKQANFSNSRLINSQITSVAFENANFSGADFSAANFEKVTFSSCNMTGASFNGTDLTNAQMENLKVNTKAKVKKKK